MYPCYLIPDKQAPIYMPVLIIAILESRPLYTDDERRLKTPDTNVPDSVTHEAITNKTQTQLMS